MLADASTAFSHSSASASRRSKRSDDAMLTGMEAIIKNARHEISKSELLVRLQDDMETVPARPKVTPKPKPVVPEVPASPKVDVEALLARLRRAEAAEASQHEEIEVLEGSQADLSMQLRGFRSRLELAEQEAETLDEAKLRLARDLMLARDGEATAKEESARTVLWLERARAEAAEARAVAQEMTVMGAHADDARAAGRAIEEARLLALRLEALEAEQAQAQSLEAQLAAWKSNAAAHEDRARCEHNLSQTLRSQLLELETKCLHLVDRDVELAREVEIGQTWCVRATELQQQLISVEHRVVAVQERAQIEISDEEAAAAGVAEAFLSELRDKAVADLRSASLAVRRQRSTVWLPPPHHAHMTGCGFSAVKHRLEFAYCEASAVIRQEVEGLQRSYSSALSSEAAYEDGIRCAELAALHNDCRKAVEAVEQTRAAGRAEVQEVSLVAQQARALARSYEEQAVMTTVQMTALHAPMCRLWEQHWQTPSRDPSGVSTTTVGLATQLSENRQRALLLEMELQKAEAAASANGATQLRQRALPDSRSQDVLTICRQRDPYKTPEFPMLRDNPA